MESYLLTILLVTCIKTVSTQSCPSICYCDKTTQVNCANVGILQIPPQYPPDTTIINMQVNSVKNVGYNAIGNLSKLLVLRLDQNMISVIAPKAFYGLTNLNQLILSVNNLNSLPDTIVDNSAPLLKGIHLLNNNFTTFPLGFLLKTQKLININNNPIRCDCFSIIPTSLKAKVDGTCSSPPKLKGRLIHTITAKDVNCEVCSSKVCNNGICYTLDGKTAKCSCFQGFKGSSCTSPSTIVNPITSLNPTMPTLVNATFLPKTHQYISIKRTGDRLSIKGCELISSRLLIDSQFYWLKDQVVFISTAATSMNKIKSSYRYVMSDLVIEKTNYVDEGVYQCCVQIGKHKLSSNAVYVQFQGEFQCFLYQISIKNNYYKYSF